MTKALVSFRLDSPRPLISAPGRRAPGFLFPWTVTLYQNIVAKIKHLERPTGHERAEGHLSVFRNKLGKRG